MDSKNNKKNIVIVFLSVFLILIIIICLNGISWTSKLNKQIKELKAVEAVNAELNTRLEIKEKYIGTLEDKNVQIGRESLKIIQSIKDKEHIVRSLRTWQTTQRQKDINDIEAVKKCQFDFKVLKESYLQLYDETQSVIKLHALENVNNEQIISEQKDLIKDFYKGKEHIKIKYDKLNKKYIKIIAKRKRKLSLGVGVNYNPFTEDFSYGVQIHLSIIKI